MKKGNLLFSVSLLTVVIARISVLIVPNVDIYVFGINFHHFWLGLIIVLLSLILIRARSVLGLIIFGFGLGLMIDQFVFMILGGGGDNEYWSSIPFVGVVIMVVIFFIVRNRVSDFYFRDSILDK